MRYPKGYFKSKFPRAIKVKTNRGPRADAMFVGVRRCHHCKMHFTAFTDASMNVAKANEMPMYNYVCYECQ